jgi:hypothetical protein
VEWDILAAWVVANNLASNNVVWLIQIPRLYNVYRDQGIIENFAQVALCSKHQMQQAACLCAIGGLPIALSCATCILWHPDQLSWTCILQSHATTSTGGAGDVCCHVADAGEHLPAVV